MLVLDTNVLSAVIRPTPDTRVVSFLDRQHAGDIAVTAITEAEVRYGIARLDQGARRSGLEIAADRLFHEVFGDRVLPFDSMAARYYGELVARREAAGRPISAFDGAIAAVCRVRDASLVTFNVRDFEDVGIAAIEPTG